MSSARKVAVPAACALVIAWVNAYICRDLFRIEYTGHTNSLQGLWIAMARLAREQWFRPGWWPFQDGGMPFEHVYMPLVPAWTAVWAWLAHCSPARAFNGVTGVVYILGPVTLFVMAWRMTGSSGYSFWAALAYSLTSPARALIRDPVFNPEFLWTSRRLYTEVVWDDVPHGAALCFFPLALLFLWRSIERPRPGYYLAAGACALLTVAASVFGAAALAMGCVCLLAALPREQWRRAAAVIGAAGAAAYAAVSPFLPPSLLATVRANQQQYVEDRWSAASWYGLAIVAAGWLIAWWCLDRAHASRPLRFFVLLAWIVSAIPLLDAYANLHFLPQAGRYQPEMEMALPLAVVFGVRGLAARLPLGVKPVLALLLLVLAGRQAVSFRSYARDTIRPVDITHSIEYRVARWMDAHMAGQRVMVPGSIAQWFNVFSDTPQLSGGSYSTTPNPAQQLAMVSVLSGKGPAQTQESVLWLKAFGTHAVTVCGPRSTEFWKPYADPARFDGLLPVLWREDDVTIFAVPQRSPTLAHVVPAVALPRGTSPADLLRYVRALDDPALPDAAMRWENFRRVRITAEVHPGQVISVQTGYHPGWHAIANGRAASIARDGLGFLAIVPRCDGACEIVLDYDGGWEYRICRLLSAFTLLGAAAWVLWRCRPSSARLRSLIS